MMKIIKSIIILMLTLSIFSCVFTTNSEGAIAVTSFIQEQTIVLRGANYTNTIFIHNTDETYENVTLNATGILENIITFYAENDLTTPINSTILPPTSLTKVKMKLQVPYDWANGDYNGEIYVEQIGSTNLTSGENSTAVHVVYPVAYYFTIGGDEDFNISITQFTIVESEEDYPLIINVFFNNTGNVVAEPQINITFFKDDYYQGQVSAKGSVEPGDQFHKISLSWDTVGKSAGEFIAKVKITARDEILMDKNVSFKLFPEGTFTRSGELLKLGFEQGELIGKNEWVKIIAEFKNTGEVGTYAKFVGEVYFNGKLIESIESDELLVPRYATGYLKKLIKLRNESGEYTIQGQVNYDGVLTDSLTLSFQVGNINKQDSPINFKYILIIGGIILIGLIAFISRKKIISTLTKTKKKSRKKTKREKNKKTKKGKKPISTKEKKHKDIENKVDKIISSKNRRNQTKTHKKIKFSTVRRR